MCAGPHEAASRKGWVALFRSALVESRNAMVLVEDRRRVVDGNGAYLRLIGRPRDDVIGRPVHRYLAGGPVLSDREFAAALAARRVTGHAEGDVPG